MSTYYYFYIGLRDNKTNDVTILGPYDNNGKLHEITWRTGSYISDLHDEFWQVEVEHIEEKYREKFSESSWSDDDKRISRLYYKDINDLPKGSYIKSGYFLIKDVLAYQEGESSTDELFYENLTPLAYSAKVTNELTFGPPKKTTDDYGNEYTPYSAADYMWFCYPDYLCKEYEAYLFREALEMLYDTYDPYYKDKDVTPVALIRIC